MVRNNLLCLLILAQANLTIKKHINCPEDVFVLELSCGHGVDAEEKAFAAS